LEVEGYIREKMGACEFTAFQAAIIRGEEAHMQMLGPLTLALAQSGICFGDGPRWKASNVMIPLNAWVSTVVRYSMGKDMGLKSSYTPA